MKLVICDFNRTLFDPSVRRLYTGAINALRYFQQHGAKVVILSTEAAERSTLVAQLGLAEYCDEIRFVPEKTKEIVLAIMGQHTARPSEVLIIGDDPEGELLIGAQLHLLTVAVGTGYCSPETATMMGLPFYLSINDITEMNL